MQVNIRVNKAKRHQCASKLLAVKGDVMPATFHTKNWPCLGIGAPVKTN